MTDCLMTSELVLTHVHPGISTEAVRAATSWSLVIADDVAETEAPTERELLALRELTVR